MAYISRKLVTLKTDVDLAGLQITPFVFNTPAALEFVREKLESNSLAAKIEKLFPLENIIRPHSQKSPAIPAPNARLNCRLSPRIQKRYNPPL